MISDILKSCSFSSQMILIGDLMLDCYEQGTIERISPEAPVPVVKIVRRWSRLGGAGHVAASLAALGAAVSVAGVVGDDCAGVGLVEALRLRDIDASLVFPTRDLATIRKTRILAGNSAQVLRIDEEPFPEAMSRAMHDRVDQVLSGVSRAKAVVLSDYDKGTLSPELLRRLIRKAKDCGLPVAIDPKKKDFSPYQGARVITLNHLEAQAAFFLL